MTFSTVRKYGVSAKGSRVLRVQRVCCRSRSYQGSEQGVFPASTSNCLSRPRCMSFSPLDAAIHMGHLRISQMDVTICKTKRSHSFVNVCALGSKEWPRWVSTHPRFDTSNLKLTLRYVCQVGWGDSDQLQYPFE